MRHLALVVLAGCALTSKAKPVTVHYYAPQVPTNPEEKATPVGSVRLGRVWASNHLGYSIAYRVSPVELELYDLDRWTDTPDAFAKRSLEHALFGTGRFRQVTSGNAPTLDVEVLAFEEVRTPREGGRVQLRYAVRDDHGIVASDVVTVERPAKSASLTDVVSAIGSALDEASMQVADRVVAAGVAHPVQPGGNDDVSGHRVSRRR